MATAKLSAYGTLIRNKLVAFGVPSDEATRILAEGRLAHQWGPKKRDVEYLTFNKSIVELRFLGFAEHIARVFHNFGRCYHVDTTRLAMAARVEG